MNPGRDLDAIVAEKVMGCSTKKDGHMLAGIVVGERLVCNCEKGEHNTNPRFPNYGVKDYSTDISAAWEVVEKVRPSFSEIWIGRSDTEMSAHWKCSIQKMDSNYEATADTAPHAICLAALKAVGVEVG